MVAALWMVLGLASGGAAPPGQRVSVPEGWYELVDGEGEPELAEIIVDSVPPPTAGETPSGDGAAAAVQARPRGVVAGPLESDCAEVRGRYLERVLELHGLDTFNLEPRWLEVWTHRRPSPEIWPFGFSPGLGDPALSILYGEPPVPAGSLSSDFTLQNLAGELLRCDALKRPTAPPRPQEPLAPL